MLSPNIERLSGRRFDIQKHCIIPNRQTTKPVSRTKCFGENFRLDTRLKTPMDFTSSFKTYDEFVDFVQLTRGLDMRNVQDVQVRIVWSNIEEILSDRYRKKKPTQDHDAFDLYCDIEGFQNGDLACRMYDT